VPFVLVGISHQTAPVDVREQVFIPPTQEGECVRRLIDREFIDSGVLLSTCNRTELYAVASGDDPPDRLLEAFGLWPHALPFEAWRRYAYQLEGDDAMAHLFGVAAGLDSLVVGEAQILGQIKDALGRARSAGVIDPRLEIILHGAIRAGKRTRTETELGRKPVSVAHAAVAHAAEILGGLTGRGVLLIGTGPMSQVALRLLANQRIGPVFVTSRTIERADRIVQELGGVARTFDTMIDCIGDVDIIMSSTGAPHQVLDRQLVEAFQSRRSHRLLLIIDMAVPRDVDPDVSLVAGVRLRNIDDLQITAQNNREARKAWIPAAESIVEEELRATKHALEARQPAATIKALVDRVEHMRDGVLERQLARVPDGDERARGAMRALAEALTRKFLHGPIRALRESPDPVLESAVLNDAFDLDEDPS